MSDPAPIPAERSHTTQLAGLQPGSRVDGYLIECELGRGGMGIVYRAKHVGLDKPVAIKIIAVNASTNSGAINRLKREGEILARLRHPNILAVTDCGEINGLPYLVLDYAEGGTVEDWVRSEGGKLPAANVHGVVRDMLSGLKSAHEAGLVHRDIKPANLLLEKGRTIRISDFGLAQAFSSSGNTSERVRGESTQTVSDSTGTVTLPNFSASQTTSTVSFGGTLQYMAPELHSGAKGDARSDLYAVGVTAYYLLSGQKPGGKFKPVSKLVPNVHSSWDAFIGRCLEQDPKDRYQTAEAALKGLERVSLRTRSRRFVWVTASSAVLISTLAVVLLIPHKNDRSEAGEKQGDPVRGQISDGARGASPSSAITAEKTNVSLRATLVGAGDEIPNGTEIKLEGRLLGTKANAPFIVELPSTNVELTVTGPGLVPKSVHLLPSKDGTWIVPLEWVEHSISLVGVPQGSEISLDGNPVAYSGDGAIHTRVRYGQRELVIKAPFHRDFRTKLNVESDFRYTPALEWKPVITVELPEHQELVFHQIPPGEYAYGSNADEQGRQATDADRTLITIDLPYYLSETEVTQGQYAAVISSLHRSQGGIEPNPSRSRARHNPNLPVEQVSYKELISDAGFIALLNRELKRREIPFVIDLPDEIEWEIGCRAGTTTAFNNNKDLTHTGSDPSLDLVAFYNNSSSIGEPTTVRSKLPNALGLFDMEGNVAEIVRGKAPGPKRVGTGTPQDIKIFARGGSWKTPAEQTRSASRFEIFRDRKGADIGFRVLLRPIVTGAGKE